MGEAKQRFIMNYVSLNTVLLLYIDCQAVDGNVVGRWKLQHKNKQQICWFIAKEELQKTFHISSTGLFQQYIQYDIPKILIW